MIGIFYCRHILWLILAAALSAAAADSAKRVAFLSDTHVTLGTNDTGRAYNHQFEQAIAEVNAAAVDLVLIAGDVTDGGTREQMEMFKRKVKVFMAPVLYVPGNHDVGAVGDSTFKTTITSRRVALFDQVIGANWFAREAAGVRVVGLNTCLFGSGLKEEGEQWQFLESELAKTHPEPTVLLEHYPIFVKGVEEPGRSNHNVRPELRQKLLALVKQSGARAVLSGHLHYPITNRLDHVLFLGNTTTAFGLPRGKQPEGWMLLSLPAEGEITFEFRRLK